MCSTGGRPGVDVSGRSARLVSRPRSRASIAGKSDTSVAHQFFRDVRSFLSSHFIAVLSLNCTVDSIKRALNEVRTFSELSWGECYVHSNETLVRMVFDELGFRLVRFATLFVASFIFGRFTSREPPCRELSNLHLQTIFNVI